MSSPPGSPPHKPWLAIGVVIALFIVAANLAGYLLYRSRVPAVPDVAASNAPAEAPGVETGPSPVRGLALEQREAGIDALRRGDYDRAVAKLETAFELDPGVADAQALIEVARRLQTKQRGEATKPAPPAAPATGPESAEPASESESESESDRDLDRSAPRSSQIAAAARSSARARRSRRPKRAEPPVAETSPPPRAPTTGTLLVSTVPEGLLIEVDERPVELSPARLELPPGRHRVVLRRGATVVFDEAREVRAGETTSLERDLSSVTAPSVPPPPPAGSLAQDGDLDLLALVDRDRDRDRAPSPPSPAAAARTPRAPEPDLAEPTDPGGSELWVVWPGAVASEIQRSLGSDLTGIDVQVVGSLAALDRRLAGSRPAAVMASPATLRKRGWKPVLTAVGGTAGGDFVAASFERAPRLEDLGQQTLGIVDELGRRRTPIMVARLLQIDRAPRLRRVREVEDLLPLLQFSMADTVLVRPRELEILQGRTQRKLYATAVEAPRLDLALAVVDQGRGAKVERALLALPEPTKTALGIASWTR